MATCNGVAVSRSNVTGKFILSGKAKSSSDGGLMANRTVVKENPICPTKLIQTRKMVKAAL